MRGIVALVLFAAFLAWLFPTDAVVRRMLARATPPGSPTFVFGRAALRPGGIRLEDVTVHASTGDALARADVVLLRPSVRGLVDGTGLPWTVETAACDGTLDAVVSVDDDATAVAVTWSDADLAACPPLPIAAGALAGRAGGAARLRLGTATWPEGAGHVEVDGGVWRGAGMLAALGGLHAEAASVRWTLRDGRLALDAVELRGPEVTASGQGTVNLADPLAESGVQLTLAVATAPAAPGALRLLLGPPGGAAARQLRVGGTLARPTALLQ